MCVSCIEVAKEEEGCEDQEEEATTTDGEKAETEAKSLRRFRQSVKEEGR